MFKGGYRQIGTCPGRASEIINIWELGWRDWGFSNWKVTDWSQKNSAILAFKSITCFVVEGSVLFEDFEGRTGTKGGPLRKVSFLWMPSYLLSGVFFTPQTFMNDKYVTGSAAKECLVYCWRQVYTSIKLGRNPIHGITRWCWSKEERGKGEEQDVRRWIAKQDSVFWLTALHLIVIMEMSNITIHSVTQAHSLRAHNNLTLSLIRKPKPSQPLNSISLGTKHFSKRSLHSCHYNQV